MDAEGTLALAQQAIAKKDYGAAAALFGQLADETKTGSAAVPLLSRSTCLSELGDHEGARSDAERVLELPDVHSAMELVPNCFSTHAAALTRIAHTSEALGDKERATAARKQFTEYLKASATAMGAADVEREAGNALFKAGDFANALKRYEAALELDSSRPEAHGNAALALDKLGRTDEALEHVTRALAINPAWTKAWYRRGVLLRKQERFGEAVAAFQRGLTFAPDDADLRSAYVETTRLAEKAASRRRPADKPGFDPALMGMMGELRHTGFDAAAWFAKHHRRSPPAVIRGKAHDDAFSWDSEVKPRLADAALSRTIERLVKRAFPAYDAAKGPPGVVLGGYTGPATSPLAYFLPEHPLLSAIVFHAVLSHCQPRGLEQWDVVFSLALPPSLQQDFSKKHAAAPAYPFIARNGIVPLLVGETDRGTDAGPLLDLWAWFDELSGAKTPVQWGRLVLGAAVRGSDSRIAPFSSGGSSLAPEWDSDGLRQASDLIPPMLYTCSDGLKLVEFSVAIGAGSAGTANSHVSPTSAASVPQVKETLAPKAKATPAPKAKGAKAVSTPKAKATKAPKPPNTLGALETARQLLVALVAGGIAVLACLHAMELVNVRTLLTTITG